MCAVTFAVLSVLCEPYDVVTPYATCVSEAMSVSQATVAVVVPNAAIRTLDSAGEVAAAGDVTATATRPRTNSATRASTLVCRRTRA